VSREVIKANEEKEGGWVNRGVFDVKVERAGLSFSYDLVVVTSAALASEANSAVKLSVGCHEKSAPTVAVHLARENVQVLRED
jgi:hypothetical protein